MPIREAASGENGYRELPTEPGLGIAIDENKLNDDFAQDLGDYRDLGEQRGSRSPRLRPTLLVRRRSEAKNLIIEKLVDALVFPVPEEYVGRQVRNRLEARLHQMAEMGVDVANTKIDWEKAAETQREPARREVKASLLLSRIADREAIDATRR